MAETFRTIDHDEIRRWAEVRDGMPALTSPEDSKGENDILRIGFSVKDETATEISWTDFFELFEARELAFVYQEHTQEGEPSYFYEFVEREPSDNKLESDTAEGNTYNADIESLDDLDPDSDDDSDEEDE